MKAFVVNRVGDTGFLLTAFLLQRYVGTLDYAAINAAFATSPPPAAIGTAIGVLLLIGAWEIRADSAARGCRMRWPARRRCPRSSTRPRW